jgi:hypothetical protein
MAYFCVALIGGVENFEVVFHITSSWIVGWVVAISNLDLKVFFLSFKIWIWRPIKVRKYKIYKEFPHAHGGPHSRVCARETLCLDPHCRERKFFVA